MKRGLFLAAALVVGLATSAEAAFAPGFEAFRARDYGTAVAELTPAANTGDAGAAILLALIAANGYAGTADNTAALKWLDLAVAGGDLPARTMAGSLLGIRRNVAMEFAPILAVVTPRAQAGDTHAQLVLAWLTGNGLGPQRDEAAAFNLYRSAADAGDAQAQNQLGTLYLAGAGGAPKDEAAAAQWFTKAANQGYASAQAAVALLYASGRGVAKDEAAAAQWARKAADQGLAEGQFFLGGLYADGRGVAQDRAAAFTWFVRAAQQDYPPAQFQLAQMYADGGVVPQDFNEAYFWLYRGVLNSSGTQPNIDALRDKLWLRLTGDDRLADEVRALQWQPPAKKP